MSYVKLLNNGGYGGLSKVKFPIVVQATVRACSNGEYSAKVVILKELKGADTTIFNSGSVGLWSTFDREVELIEE